MTIIERKPVPVYESVCQECGSRFRYRASEVDGTFIKCPVCESFAFTTADNPVGTEDDYSCDKCKLRIVMAKYFDMHWSGEEDCPMECPYGKRGGEA